MTRVKFYADENGISGFCVSGHSTENCDDEEGKLVCASVSSAVYLVANTVTDVIGDVCDIAEQDGRMEVRVRNASEPSRTVLKGLRIHLQQLSEQYHTRIRIISEV